MLFFKVKNYINIHSLDNLEIIKFLDFKDHEGFLVSLGKKPWPKGETMYTMYVTVILRNSKIKSKCLAWLWPYLETIKA